MQRKKDVPTLAEKSRLPRVVVSGYRPHFPHVHIPQGMLVSVGQGTMLVSRRGARLLASMGHPRFIDAIPFPTVELYDCVSEEDSWRGY